MAPEDEREKSESARDFTSLIDQIRTVAAANARSDLSDEKQLILFLQSWWSKTYNRPLKDPLLLSYTLEELLYEFYDKIERKKAEQERVNSENDKIEADKEKEVLDWAEEEERKELEALKKEAGNKQEIDPTKDPDNVAWMEKQLQQGKAIFGESFGEDIEESFNE